MDGVRTPGFAWPELLLLCFPKIKDSLNDPISCFKDKNHFWFQRQKPFRFQRQEPFLVSKTKNLFGFKDKNLLVFKDKNLGQLVFERRDT